jgi:hypothetical protein
LEQQQIGQILGLLLVSQVVLSHSFQNGLDLLQQHLIQLRRLEQAVACKNQLSFVPLL